uniref:Uncharacterized protein n=1 Tax=Oryza punctata TaxID=4537 RepID=A0A0E0LJK5_ORYPU
MQPVCQPMVVGNSSNNSSNLQPTPTPLEAYSGDRNIVNKQLLQSYRISTDRTRNARKSVIYFNCRETIQFFSINRSACLKRQVSRSSSTSAMHLIWLQLRCLVSNQQKNGTNS